MARARGIKPGFFRNADMVELPMEARLLFIGLWTLADRAGRLEDRPKQIKMEIFPADNIDCNDLLEQIAQTGMLERYEVDGKRFLQVVNFCKHQYPHKDERPSTIPDKHGNHAAIKEAPGKHGVSTVPQSNKTDAATMPIRLTADSCILTADSGLLTADCPILGGEGVPPPSPAGSPPPFLPEYREFIKTERPDLDAEVVFANFREHYPAEKCTPANWRKWVRREHPGPVQAGGVAPLMDPDSRGAIEALGLSLGFGKWSENEHWSAYKSRVKSGVPA